MHIPSSTSECTSNTACTSAVGACISNHREMITGHKCVTCKSRFCNHANVAVLLCFCVVMAHYYLQYVQNTEYIPLEGVSNVIRTSLSV